MIIRKISKPSFLFSPIFHNRMFFPSFTLKYKSATALREIPDINAQNPKTCNLRDVGEKNGFHNYLKEKHDEYGPIFSMNLFGDKIVSINHPKYYDALANCKERSASTQREFFPVLFNDLESVVSASLINREHRYETYIKKSMKNDIIKTHYVPVMVKHTQKLIEKWTNLIKTEGLNDKKVLSFIRDVELTQLRISSEIIVGPSEIDDAELEEFRRCILTTGVETELAEQQGLLQGERRTELKERANTIELFHKTRAEKRMALRNEGKITENTCIIDFIAEANDQKLLQADCHTYTLGFATTTIALVNHSLYHLANNYKCQTKVHNEVDKVFDKNEYNTDYTRELKYLKACLNESLRLTAPIPFFARVTGNEDVVLPDNYVVPKNTSVMFPVGNTLKDENVWKEGSQFKPERFSEEGMDYNHQFSVFAFPQRMCPGKNLGLVNAQIITGMILRNFEMKLAEGQGPMKLHHGNIVTIEEEINLEFKLRI